MSVLRQFLPRLLNVTTQICGVNKPALINGFHTFNNTNTLVKTNPGGLFNITVRNIIRYHFPRPCERKRVKRHGWLKRLSTPAGRRIIMRRILKGRHVLTH